MTVTWEQFKALALRELNAGNLPAAEASWRTALDLAQTFGEDDMRYIASLESLSEILFSQRKYAEAESDALKLLTIYERKMGPDHVDVGLLSNNVGMLMHAQNKVGEAETFYRRALNILTPRLGMHHPQTTSIVTNLSNLLEAQGRRQDADSLRTSAQSVTKGKWNRTGRYSPVSFLATQELPPFESEKTVPAPAPTAKPISPQPKEPTKRDFVVRTAEFVLPPEPIGDPFISSPEADPAVAPQPPSDEEILKDLVVALSQSQFGADNVPLKNQDALPETVSMQDLLDGLTGGLSKTLDSPAVKKEPVDLPELPPVFKGPKGWNIGDAMAVDNPVDPVSQQPPAKEEKIEKPAKPVDPTATADFPIPGDDMDAEAMAAALVNWEALMAQAQNSLRAGHLSSAEDGFFQALDTARIFDRLDPRVTMTMESLAEVLWKQEKYEDAETLCEMTLEIYEQSLGPNHKDVGIITNNLAMLYHASDKLDKAEQAYKRALAIRSKVQGPTHPDVITLMTNYANLLELMNREQEATHLRAFIKSRTSGRWTRCGQFRAITHEGMAVSQEPKWSKKD